MNEELVKLREFVAAFRIWKTEMNNHSFRKVLDRLRALDQVGDEVLSPDGHAAAGHGCLSGVCE